MPSKEYTIYEDDEDMEGPYSFDEDVIADLDDDLFGVYMLLSDGEDDDPIVRYVGRGNIKERLMKHLNRACTQFLFKELRSRVTAFREECRLFHKYGKARHLDNRIHPPRPEDRDDLPLCSEDGCEGEPS